MPKFGPKARGGSESASHQQESKSSKRSARPSSVGNAGAKHQGPKPKQVLKLANLKDHCDWNSHRVPPHVARTSEVGKQRAWVEEYNSEEEALFRRYVLSTPVPIMMVVRMIWLACAVRPWRFPLNLVRWAVEQTIRCSQLFAYKTNHGHWAAVTWLNETKRANFKDPLSSDRGRSVTIMPLDGGASEKDWHAGVTGHFKVLIGRWEEAAKESSTQKQFDPEKCRCLISETMTFVTRLWLYVALIVVAMMGQAEASPCIAQLDGPTHAPWISHVNVTGCPSVLCGQNFEVGAEFGFVESTICSEGDREWLVLPYDPSTWVVYRHSGGKLDWFTMPGSRELGLFRAHLDCNIAIPRPNDMLLGHRSFGHVDIGEAVFFDTNVPGVISGLTLGPHCMHSMAFSVFGGVGGEYGAGSFAAYLPWRDEDGNHLKMYLPKSVWATKPSTIGDFECVYGAVDTHSEGEMFEYWVFDVFLDHYLSFSFDIPGGNKDGTTVDVPQVFNDCTPEAVNIDPHQCGFNQYHSAVFGQGCHECEAGKFALGRCGDASLCEDLSSATVQAAFPPISIDGEVCDFCGVAADCPETPYVTHPGPYLDGNELGAHEWGADTGLYELPVDAPDTERALATAALAAGAICPTMNEGRCVDVMCYRHGSVREGMDRGSYSASCRDVAVGQGSGDSLDPASRCWDASADRADLPNRPNMWLRDWWTDQPQLYHMIQKDSSSCCSCTISLMANVQPQYPPPVAGYICRNTTTGRQPQPAKSDPDSVVVPQEPVGKKEGSCSWERDHTDYHVDCGSSAMLDVSLSACGLKHSYYQGSMGLSSKSSIEFREVDAHAKCDGMARLEVTFASMSIAPWVASFDHRPVTKCDMYSDTTFWEAISWESPLMCWSGEVLAGVLCSIIGVTLSGLFLLRVIYVKLSRAAGYQNLEKVVLVDGEKGKKKRNKKVKTQGGKATAKTAFGLGAFAAAALAPGRAGACGVESHFATADSRIVMSDLHTGGTYCVQSSQGSELGGFCNMTVSSIQVILQPVDCYTTYAHKLVEVKKVLCDGHEGCSADSCAAYASEEERLDGHSVKEMHGTSFSECERVTFDRDQCSADGDPAALFTHHTRRCQVNGWKVERRKDAQTWSVCRLESIGAAVSIGYYCQTVAGGSYSGVLGFDGTSANVATIGDSGIAVSGAHLHALRDLSALSLDGYHAAFRADGKVVLAAACPNGQPCDGFGAVQRHTATYPDMYSGYSTIDRDYVHAMDVALEDDPLNLPADGVELPNHVGGLLIRHNYTELFVTDPMATVDLTVSGLPAPEAYEERVCGDIVSVESGGGCFNCPSQASALVTIRRGPGCASGVVSIVGYVEGRVRTSAWVSVGAEAEEYQLAFPAKAPKTSLRVKAFDSSGDVTSVKTGDVSASSYDPKVGTNGNTSELKHEKSHPKLNWFWGVSFSLSMVLVVGCCVLCVCLRKA